MSAAAAYFAALADGDRNAALDVVRAARAAGASVLDVMDDVVVPAQHRVGELWATDEWSVAREHAATAVSEAVLGLVGAEVPTPADPSSPVVVSCVEQEWHALPALLVAEHLRTAGVPVSYLGANSSAEYLVRHVHELAPRAVALSCSLSASLPRVRRQIAAVRATGTPVLVGGAAFDRGGRRAATLGATAYAADGAAAVDAVRRLPTATVPAPGLSHPRAADGFALHADREELAARLHSRVVTLVAVGAGADRSAAWVQALADHLPHLVGAVAGALVADDDDVLEDAVAWLDAVLEHRSAPEGTTRRVTAELDTVVREYPAAGELVSRLVAATAG